MWKMAVLMVVGAIAALQPSASAAADIPFTITWSGGTFHGVICVQLAPFRRTPCLKIGPGAEDHREIYRADDTVLSAAGQWGCTLYRFDTCSQARDGIGFCSVGGPDQSRSVDLFYDDKNLTVNRPRKCAVATVSGVLGFNGEDDETPRQDLDTYSFAGKAGEKVAVKLDRDGGSGSLGEVATLRVRTPAGAVLGQRIGPVPLSLELTLPGPVEITALRQSGDGEPFRGYYALEVAPASGDVGDRQLKPTANVEH
jgi:hypothetical protein